jgi:4-amino-4-deoxy-L-arabinose transferase-like glycosyltransferase
MRANERDVGVSWKAGGLLLILVAFALRAMIAPGRIHNTDEFQHLHVAYSIAHGLTPFVDFFEHHTPWFTIGLSWLYPIWGDSTQTIIAARYLMVALTVPILVTTYLLGRQLYGRFAGLLAVVLLSYTLAFLEKTIEIRPDVPEVACWLAGLAILVRAARNGSWRAYAFSGLAFGSALMFSQKAIFGILGVLALLAWVLLDRRIEGRPGPRAAAAFAAGCALPGVVTLLHLAEQGALAAFVEQAVAMNLRWKFTFSPWIYLSQIVRESPLQVSFGIGGWMIALIGSRRADAWQSGVWIPIAGTGATMLGLLVVPVPYLQFFQLLLPLWCIYAASVLCDWIEDPRRLRGAGGLLVALLFVACLAYSVSESKSAQWAWIWALVAVGVPLTWRLDRSYGRRARLGALALVLTAVVAFPAVVMARQSQQRGNQRLLNVIEYVLDETDPDEPVLTSWRGSAPFRPHAYYYFFLHEEIQLMLGREKLSADLLELLKEEEPRLLEFDDAFRLLDDELIRYVVRHYRPTGHGVVLERRERALPLRRGDGPAD